MWRCPSITPRLGTNQAVPCRKVWISLDNQGTSSPQFCCGCSGREKEKQLFRAAEGVQHILTVPGILGLSIIPSSFYQQEFVSPPADSLEILVLPSLFLPSWWGQHFIFQCRFGSPPALGFGSGLSLAQARGLSPWWDRAELGGSESGITPTVTEVPQAGR